MDLPESLQNCRARSLRLKESLHIGTNADDLRGKDAEAREQLRHIECREVSQLPPTVPCTMLSQYSTPPRLTSREHREDCRKIPLSREGCHTGPAGRVVLSLDRPCSYAIHFQARLLPASSRQATRSERARYPLPDLDPLLEVWEQDLLPWETGALSSTANTLPWEGDTFAWEPASQHSIPFGSPRSQTTTDV
jgi:hypothetical protein